MRCITSYNVAIKYYKDEPKDPITDYNSFKFKARLLTNTNNRGIINAEIPVPLKYLTNFWRNLELPLINCEIKLVFT